MAADLRDAEGAEMTDIPNARFINLVTPPATITYTPVLKGERSCRRDTGFFLRTIHGKNRRWTLAARVLSVPLPNPAITQLTSLVPR
jgi:hypothetical protein